MTDRILYIVSMCARFCLVLFCSLSPLPAFCDAPDHNPQTQSSPGTISDPIPFGEIALQSTKIMDYLTTVSSQLSSRNETEKILPTFYQLKHEIDLESGKTMKALEGNPSLARLQPLQAAWKSRRQRIAGWMGTLTESVTGSQKEREKLEEVRRRWETTREAVMATASPLETRLQITTVLTTLDAVIANLRVRNDGLLSLQSIISKAMNQCSDILSRIDQTQKHMVSGLLIRSDPPVWNQGQWEKAGETFVSDIEELQIRLRDSVSLYFTDASREMPLHAGFLVVLAVVFFRLGRPGSNGDQDSVTTPLHAAVFERPFAAAMLAVWILVTRYASPTPQIIQELYTLVAIAAILRLIWPAVPRYLVPVLLPVAALYALDVVREMLNMAVAAEQILLLLEGAAGIGILLKLMNILRQNRSSADEPEDGRRKMLEILAGTALLTLAAGSLAVALGYLLLGRILTPGIISSAALSMALLAGVRVFGAIAAVCLRIRPLVHLKMVRRHLSFLEKRTYHLLGLMAFVGWVVRTLDHVALLDPITAFGRAILETRLERGSISIAVEDVLAFVVAIWLSQLISRFICFAMEEEVYPRAGTPSGTAYASSRLLHYSIVALGFVLGLGLLGMDLSKISVMAGAFGVGIGFGLQNIVNNMVSGLILLFEQPIHVGDTIETGGVLGEVRRIGFRASTVRTLQGADIIIPNAQFITAEVINWTLNDRMRCIKLPVSVSYADNPREVVALLEKVARDNPQILSHPPPKGLFTDYGDSAINFELRSWTDHFSDFYTIRSDLNTAIYDAVKAAGMIFPFPQREVRLLGGEEPGPAGPTPVSG